jgi:predicted HD phosphohydrolase
MSEAVTAAKPIVNYIRMEDGTAEEYLALRDLAQPFRAGKARRMLGFLDGLHNSYPGEQVDRYEHSLQTATRAFRDGAEEEVVVAALLHDIGDMLAPDNHALFAATVLQPYVSASTHWVVEKHGIFQGLYYFHHYGKDRNEREKYRGHPDFEKCAEFCGKWDQMAFDPNYDTMPLAAFEPMVERVFAREPWGPATKKNG